MKTINTILLSLTFFSFLSASDEVQSFSDVESEICMFSTLKIPNPEQGENLLFVWSINQEVVPSNENGIAIKINRSHGERLVLQCEVLVKNKTRFESDSKESWSAEIKTTYRDTISVQEIPNLANEPKYQIDQFALTLMAPSNDNNLAYNWLGPDSSVYETQIVLVKDLKLDQLGIYDLELSSSKNECKNRYKLNVMANEEIDVNRVTFIGRADLQTLTNDLKNNSEGNIGFGLKGYNRFPKKFMFFKDVDVLASINVASTADSIRVDNLNDRRLFGNAVLNPVNTAQAVSFSAHLSFAKASKPRKIVSKKYKDKKTGECLKRPKTLDPDRFKVFGQGGLFEGLFVEFYGSNRVWSLKTDDDVINSHASSILTRIGLFHEFLNNDYGFRNRKSIQIGAAYSFRGVFGDVLLDDGGKRRLDKFFSTDLNKFRSVDLILKIELNDIKAKFVFPIINPPGDIEVAGLSNNQLYTGIQFVGGFPIGK